jgi:hypothetical protein
MARPRSLAAALALALLAGPACVVPSADRQLLMHFFAACEVYDTVVMARFGTAPCNPRTDGVVESFDIVERSDTEVMIAARVRQLGGESRDQRIRIGLARNDEGRLTVSAITRLPASRTLPAASSAPPN